MRMSERDRARRREKAWRLRGGEGRKIGVKEGVVYGGWTESVPRKKRVSERLLLRNLPRFRELSLFHRISSLSSHSLSPTSLLTHSSLESRCRLSGSCISEPPRGVNVD